MKTEKKILIVEDEISLKKALVDKLTREGFEVLEASNGEEGLQIALEEVPDLILLDIVMPKMDGITMFKHLRANKKGRYIGVIILSNLADNERSIAAMGIGAHDYLIKTNWSLRDVLKKIRKYFAEHPE
ncbi:MAG: response regulator [Nanoarchaeota archaeon]|nr:response regulator [Nanoarchaeota archaeon]